MTPTTGPTPHPDHGSTPAPMPTRATSMASANCRIWVESGRRNTETWCCSHQLRVLRCTYSNGSLIYGWLFTRSLACPGKYKCPPFERDDAWYSVVIHGVPMPPDGGLETYTVGNMAAYLNYAGAFVGAVKAFSILCRPEDLKSR
ncbi:hypothetical protein B0H14DRAFT_2587540 [Mycena olivaceomarginata]|nr:hypothetical protein B0H14DRAFT_2587540 [Mycena olivaceomarginata]